MKLKITLSGLLLVFITTINVQASTDTDILLDLLVKKGVLTQQEADSTKAELVQKKQEEEKKQLEEAKKQQQKPEEKKQSVTSSLPFNIGGLFQTEYSHGWGSVDKDSLSIHRARLNFSSKPDEHWDWYLQGEWGSNNKGTLSSVSFNTSKNTVSSTKTESAYLLDVYAGYKFNDYARIQAGQFKIPFSLENLASDADLEFIDRSQVVSGLVPGRDNGNIGRDIGVQVNGSYSPDSSRKWVDYAFGVFNGAGINTGDDNNDKDFAGRVVVYPLPDLSLGASGYKGHATSSLTKHDRLGAELAYVHDPFTFKTEYIYGEDTNKKDGWYIEGAYKFAKQWQAAVRYDTYNSDKNTSGSSIDQITLGLNWSINPHHKVQLDYERQSQDSNTDNNVFELQYQYRF